MSGSLRLPYGVLTAIFGLSALASMLALLAVLSTRNAEALGAVALYLAVVTFVAQVLMGAFQDSRQRASERSIESTVLQTNSVLAEIKSTAVATREILSDQQQQMIQKLLNDIVPQVVDSSLPETADNERLSASLKEGISTQFSKMVSAPAPYFRVGERVWHPNFGFGSVIESAPQIDGDLILAVNFDEEGTRRLSARFAALSRAPEEEH